MRSAFTPLDAKVAESVAQAVGVDTSRAVGMALEFPEPGVTILAVQFLVDSAAFVRVLEALRAISDARPIGVDALGMPIFRAEPVPEGVRSHVEPSAGATGPR